MFYLFLVGLAKLHCGVTLPSVMVLFSKKSTSILQVANGVFLDVSVFLPLHMKRWLQNMVFLKLSKISIS